MKERLKELINTVLKSRESLGKGGEDMLKFVATKEDLEIEEEATDNCIRIVTEEEAQKADAVVCMPLGPSEFKDNLEGKCIMCDCDIMFRPHIPYGVPKVCLDCIISGHDQNHEG